MTPVSLYTGCPNKHANSEKIFRSRSLFFFLNWQKRCIFWFWRFNRYNLEWRDDSFGVLSRSAVSGLDAYCTTSSEYFCFKVISVLPIKRSSENNVRPHFKLRVLMMIFLNCFYCDCWKVPRGSKIIKKIGTLCTVQCTQYTVDPFKYLPLSPTVFLVEMWEKRRRGGEERVDTMFWHLCEFFTSLKGWKGERHAFHILQ